jgi:uncharacterized protein (DUF362 family)
VNRRAFLKLAGLCGSSIFLHGCRRPAELFETITATIPATPSPLSSGTDLAPSIHTPVPSQTASPSATPTLTLESTATPPPGAQIALVKGESRLDGVQRALDLLGAGDFRGKRLLVKPNYNSAHPAPGSTDNEILIPTLQWLQDRGADRLEVWDRSGMGNTRAVMQQKGLPGLADDYGFEYFPFDDLEAEEWVMVSFEGSYWPDGYPIARPVLEADGVVSLCCLKTHRFGGHFTLSLKNSVGMVAKTVPGQTTDYMAGILHRSAHQRDLIADINRAYSPDLIVLDGMQAFINRGPETGEIVDPGVILVGTDRVAMDAVGVAILRLYGTTPEVQNGPIFEQAQIARAVALGIGVDKPEKIELVTEDQESALFADEIRRVLLQDG